MSDALFVIGIDLGTTNSVVAYTDVKVEKGKPPDIRVFNIPQLVAPGAVEERSSLPSFIFQAGGHDMSQDALKLPWDAGRPDLPSSAVGVLARERGREIPQRLVSSSKSWLCNSRVDRTKELLPWDAPENVSRISPVVAAGEILTHIRKAWNHRMAGPEYPDAAARRMEFQDVLLTVPASFDAVARELTVQAAAAAGLENVTLLEEPQAAFYAWISGQGEKWREQVKKGDTILVCDVGGGTTDFSMIQVEEEDGDLILERVSVGDHLLVGGDNMDLALAWAVSNRLKEEGGKKLDSWQMRGLWHACRAAKEGLLETDGPREMPVAVLGRGSSLIGGTRKTSVPKEMVEQVILDGFFPPCGRTDMPREDRSAGLRELGLVYESDPAVTRHLAKFLGRQRSADAAEPPPLPTGVLFNGGVMKAPAVRKRIMEVMNGWAGREGRPPVEEVRTSDFDMTVARGAACYGMARRGQGIRIRGGLNRSYYIGVAAALPAVPGMPIPMKAVCVAPFGMEEGAEAALPGQEFMLVTGEPVKFDFMASSTRLEDEIGAVIHDWEEEIKAVTTVETTLDGEEGAAVPVGMAARVTEIGTLELWCAAIDDPNRRWKLEFNVREAPPEPESGGGFGF